MDAYEQLKADARKVRDKAVYSARQEYQIALRRIDQLRRQITGEAPAYTKKADGTMTRRMIALLPTQGAFTALDLLRLMQSDPIGSKFAEHSIRSALPKLHAMGKIRKVSRRDGYVQWATESATADVCPFGGATLADIAESLLKERGPMRINELVVVMRERGYRPNEMPGTTASNMRRAITRFSHRFEKGIDGRWGLAVTA